MIALTHVPSPRIEHGERTHVERVPIDHALALRQHEAYRQTLRECGCELRVLDVNRDYPDAVFIEDTAVVLDEVAVLCSMGAPSRRGEPPGIEAVLREYREVRRIELPATLEGGDVLRVGRTLLVGRTGRTNAAGIEALGAVARPFGYQVVPVRLQGCLHLKSACTALPDGRLLANPAWIEGDIAGFRLVSVSDDEPAAANVVPVGQAVVISAGHAGTADLLGALGFDIRPVGVSEFAKAEGAVTCLSLLLRS